MKYVLFPLLGIGHILLFAWIASLLYPWIGWAVFLVIPMSVPLVFGPLVVFLTRGRLVTVQDYVDVMNQPPGY